MKERGTKIFILILIVLLITIVGLLIFQDFNERNKYVSFDLYGEVNSEQLLTSPPQCTLCIYGENAYKSDPDFFKRACGVGTSGVSYDRSISAGDFWRIDGDLDRYKRDFCSLGCTSLDVTNFDHGSYAKGLLKVQYFMKYAQILCSSCGKKFTFTSIGCSDAAAIIPISKLFQDTAPLVSKDCYISYTASQINNWGLEDPEELKYKCPSDILKATTKYEIKNNEFILTLPDCKKFVDYSGTGESYFGKKCYIPNQTVLCGSVEKKTAFGFSCKWGLFVSNWEFNGHTHPYPNPVTL